MKKGFTLIELLAVIVILAVIALIATPAILNTIEDSKKSVAEASARNIVNTTRTYYMQNVMDNKLNKNIDLTNSELKYDGEQAKKGVLNYDENGNVTGKMYINNYCIEVNNNVVTSKKIKESECEINNTPEASDTTAPTLEVLSRSVSATSYTITVTTSDESGIKEVRYYIDDKLVHSGTDLTYSATSTNTKVTYKVESEDIYGNVATKTGTIYLSQCFVAGTKVLTKDGYKNIEDIKVGEYVYTFDPINNIKGLSLVTDTIKTKNNKIYEITLINGEVIKATEKHPFYILDKGWVRSYDLKVGDELTSSKYGLLKIKNIIIKNYDEPINTYNLTIDGEHSYLITEYEILVHNATQSPTNN